MKNQHICSQNAAAGCLDALAAWMPGCLDACMPGCLAAWMLGCLDAGMPGCLAAWIW